MKKRISTGGLAVVKQCLNQLPLTRYKIFIAHILYVITRFFVRSDHQLTRRNGIWYSLDLSEGIDLSIFLFGNFQQHVFNKKWLKLPENPVIIDVGANIGHMSLTYAKLFPDALVYAFEPTDYAVAKLQANLGLNQTLASRIEAVKAFLSDQSEQSPSITAYASWKIAGHASNESTHPIHLGTAKDSKDTPAMTLDDFVRQRHLPSVDFIKIDTDGHEIKVLSGARETIAQYHPIVLFEAGLYVLSEKNVRFDDFFDLFEPLGYQFVNSKNDNAITRSNYREEIPEQSTTDVLAICRPSLTTVAGGLP